MRKQKATRYTSDQIEEALRASAGIRSVAARKLGCSPTTVGKYIERYKKLRSVIAEVVDETLDLAEGQMLKAIGDGNMTAIIFYLKTKGKNRGYVERTELSGKEGGPIEISNARRQLAAAVARVVARRPEQTASSDCDAV